MTTDLVRRDTDSWVDVFGSVGSLADSIARTEFVPDQLKGKPAAIVACILYGREVGIGPMQALQSIYVVNGRPTMSAELMRTQVFAAGHRIVYLEQTNTRCVVEGYRAGDDRATAKVTYTMDDAKQAKLDGKNTWRQNPRQMLAARATAELCRLAFPDAIAGLSYTADELESVDGETGEITPAPTRRTARRATQPAEAVRVDQPAAETAPETPVTVDEPPLDEPPPAPTPVATPAQDWKARVEAAAARAAETPTVAPAPDGPMSLPTQRRMMALFNDVGWAERDDRLRASVAIVGRPLDSAKQLTQREASDIITVLEYAAGTADPPETLTRVIEGTLASEALADVVDGELVD